MRVTGKEMKRNGSMLKYYFFFLAVICNLVISNLATNLNGNVKLCMMLNPSVLKLELICRKGKRSVTVVIHTCFVLLFS